MFKTIIMAAFTVSVALTAVGETFTVPSGKTQTIQSAIDIAADGDEILVLPGTYLEHINYGGKTLVIKSAEGPESTIIDGQNNAPTVVLTSGGELPGTSLDGFTIRNGKNGGGQNEFGGGVHVVSDASFQIDNCIIQNCTASDSSGAGVYVKPASIEDRVFGMRNTTIKDSTATHWGGLITIEASSTDTLIEGCFFSNGHSWNGSLYIGDVGDVGAEIVTFLHCTFYDCDGSKFGTLVHGAAIFDGCVFEESHASGYNGWTGDAIAGGWFDWSDISIMNCVFLNNGGPVVSNEGAADDTGSVADSLFCSNGTPNINGNWSVENVQELESCPEFIDCNEDGIADWIQVVTHPEMDTNNNGIPDDCEVLLGACCINGYAIELPQNDCDYVSGEFMGDGTDPTDVTCSLVCSEDVNGDGLVNVSDIMAVLDVWGACP